MKKIGRILLIVLLIYTLTFTLFACNESTADANSAQSGGEGHTHSYTRKNTDAAYLKSEATCTQKGSYYYSCSCGEKGTDTFEGELASCNYDTAWTSDDANHWHKCLNVDCTSIADETTHSFSGAACTDCGKTLFQREGDRIYFGEYPQTLKGSKVTITDITDTRGYYLGSDGCYYAKLIAAPSGDGGKFQNTDTIIKGEVYYFKVAPICWRILQEDGDTALIVCQSIIANKAFDDYDDGNLINNYAKSPVRAWLNEAFYASAFSDLQKGLIQTVEVDNSAVSTGYSSNPFACQNTSDKVFLLSYKDVTNPNYGFASSDSANDSARIRNVSDYARATGAYTDSYRNVGQGWWWLRSPYSSYNYARGVYADGKANNDYDIDFRTGGIVPALQIRLR